MLNFRANAVHLLLSLGFIEKRSLVEGRVLVYDASSRHRNFVVLVGKGDGFFVKQARSTEPSAFQTIEREAALYTLANKKRKNSLSVLAELVPRFYRYDQLRNLLILEALPNAEDLLLYHSRVGVFPVELAATIGKTLGLLHSRGKQIRRDESLSALFPGKLPWVLLVHARSPAPLQSLSGANLQFLEILKRHPHFAEHLNVLRDRWKTLSLIHGDIKFANFITYSSATGSGLKLVDWEVADIGDPMWDVAGVFQAYLHFCVSAALTTQESSSHEFYNKVRVKLDQLKPAIGAFWTAYQETIGLDTKGSECDLELSISYAAARMLQSVYESGAPSQELNQHAIYLLQCSMNILNSPRRALTELFGIEI
jgi:Phosphotransferase enzyme family